MKLLSISFFLAIGGTILESTVVYIFPALMYLSNMR